MSGYQLAYICSISQFLKFISAGYAVFIADGRGSCNRGIHFESPIKFNMVNLLFIFYSYFCFQGSPEVDDQVHALKYVAEHFFPLLDLDRVGVTGWSYGHFFKCLNIIQLVFRRLHVASNDCSTPTTLQMLNCRRISGRMGAL